MNRTNNFTHSSGKERIFSGQKMLNQNKFHGFYLNNARKLNKQNSYKYDSNASSEQS